MFDPPISTFSPAVFNPADDGPRPATVPGAATTPAARPRISLVAPIRFPSDPFTRTDVGRQDAFERRRERIAAEAERQTHIMRSAQQDGYQRGHSQGWTQGARFGFGLGLLLGCALIAAGVLVSLRTGLL